MATIPNPSRNQSHKCGIIWLTGLSGSGKSTLATLLKNCLIARGYSSCVLDGDQLREGLNSDLGFSSEDREENLRRISEVAKLFATWGHICIVSTISPLAQHRNAAKQITHPLPFYEVYISADIETCKNRDPKGLYKKALLGDIFEFTGISAPYEVPLNPDLTINTAQIPLEISCDLLLKFILDKFPLYHFDYN